MRSTRVPFRPDTHNTDMGCQGFATAAQVIEVAPATPKFTLIQAIEIIRGSEKFQLRDHVYGDREVTWERDGVKIADGYFGNSARRVTVQGVTFKDEDAYTLDRIACIYPRGSFTRNDETGDDNYRGA